MSHSGSRAPPIGYPALRAVIPVWVYNDDLRIEGADLANGSFEGPATRGVPRGWRPEVRPGLWIRDPKLATSGEYCVKTPHNHRFAQQIALTKGRTVTVRVRVRGVGLCASK